MKDRCDFVDVTLGVARLQEMLEIFGVEPWPSDRRCASSGFVDFDARGKAHVRRRNGRQVHAAARAGKSKSRGASCPPERAPPSQHEWFGVVGVTLESRAGPRNCRRGHRQHSAGLAQSLFAHHGRRPRLHPSSRTGRPGRRRRRGAGRADSSSARQEIAVFAGISAPIPHARVSAGRARASGQHAGRQPREQVASRRLAELRRVVRRPLSHLESLRAVGAQHHAAKVDPAADEARMAGDRRSAGAVEHGQKGALARRARGRFRRPVSARAVRKRRLSPGRAVIPIAPCPTAGRNSSMSSSAVARWARPSRFRPA